MSADIRQVEALEARLTKANTDRARAEGAVAQLMGRLSAEFGVTTEEEARALLAQLDDKVRLLNTKAETESSDIGALMTAAGF